MPLPAGAHRPLGLEGWRFAFLSLAAISAATGAANLLLTEDPLHVQPGAPAPLMGGKAPARGRAAAAAAAEAGIEGEAGVASAPAGADEGDDAEAGLAAGEQDSERQPLRAAGQGQLSSGEGEGSSGGGGGGPSPARAGGAGSKPALAGIGQEDSAYGRSVSVRLPQVPLRERVRGIAAEVATVVRIPTFLIIVAQVGWWVRDEGSDGRGSGRVGGQLIR